ncbi:hypothetical protein P154DRAFT_577809 [Amniculicola lignicola CBS 123094]|uniref:Uncharacterized protein n=1 Tax=Amniculicola lignicola CBS 123094 TaxID=1392246 RepID=A0A6A5W9V1_9PLEO|nr:hypothetical protein P154DRAFT_577809 [Amniculicola lignicola CBS 123094]
MPHHDSEEEEEILPQAPYEIQRTEGDPGIPPNPPDMTPNTENQASRTPFFDRPGGLAGIGHQTWSKTVSSIIESCISKKSNSRFYNPSVEATDTSPTSPDNYWEQLARENSSGLTAAYERLTGIRGIRTEDLFRGNDYDRDNRWNYNSPNSNLVHTRTKNNTLDEAVDLAADATILRIDHNNRPITKGTELLARLGTLTDLRTSQRRHSDPAIMQVINNHARKGRIISVDRCPGLYIDEFDNDGFTCPRSGDHARKFWKVTRGTSDKCLRAEFEVPPDYGYVVRDIKDPRNAPIKYGSQLSPSGRDIEPFELAATFINETLGTEWFGKYLSGKTGHTTAETFSALLQQFPAYTWRAYAADEGIGISFNKERERLIENSFTVDTIALVAVPPQDDPTNLDSPKAFLQVASFSKKLGRFHFYDRERGPPGRWLYFGSSEDAFTPDTYGLGVFCGHANGGIVMKELDEPWVHWHTPRNQLELPDNHALRQCTTLLDSGDWNFGFGEDMARMVQRGNREWYVQLPPAEV